LLADCKALLCRGKLRAATSHTAHGLTLQGVLVGEYASSRPGDSPVAGGRGAFTERQKKGVTGFRHSQDIDINKEYATLEQFPFEKTGR
jgi:hypothetical protein